jgi:predicted PurR-regulated permease PerM
MSEVEPPSAPSQLRRILLWILLGSLAVACLFVLRPFLAPVLWAAILAYASWPLYRRLRRPLSRFNTFTALLMTLLMTCAVVVPVLWILMLVQSELLNAYRALTSYLARGPQALPAAIRDIPWLGNLLQEQLNRFSSDPAALAREATGWIQRSALALASVLGDIGRNFLKILFAVLTLFFLYRDGDTIAHQSRVVARRFFGDRLDPYANTTGMMTRAVLYGLLATAFAQGLMAGVGYRVVGLDGPVLLGVLTGVLSVIPAIGTGIVWAPLGVWLLMNGSVWKGVLLLVWGSLLVHPIDNVLRPLLISNATRVPFLLVLFGAIGGLTTFGLVGTFVGPVLLGIAMAIWREWANEDDLSVSTPKHGENPTSDHPRSEVIDVLDDANARASTGVPDRESAGTGVGVPRSR